MNAYIDIEFSRGKNEINSIGAIYDKQRFFQKTDKLNKTPTDLMIKLYNYLPNNEITFIYFGQEDIRILKNILSKYEYPEKIRNMLEYMCMGIDLKKFLQPLKSSLADIVSSLGGNLAKPLHDPLNDAINLQTLFNRLHDRGATSKLIKLAKYENPNIKNIDILNKNFYNNLKKLNDICKNGIYKKDNSTAIKNKIILINRENGEEFKLNDIHPEELTENIIYSIKYPKILKEFQGRKKECIVYLLEHVDSKTLSITSSLENMALYTGESIDFCTKLINELFDNEYILKLSKNTIQIKENINFEDNGNERRLVFSQSNPNKINIIA